MTDRFESNNTMSTATDLGRIFGTQIFQDLSIDTDDEDWFEFSIDQGEEIQVNFSNAQGDIDIQLLDENGGALVSSTSATDNELISLAGLAAGNYFLRVFGFAGGNNPDYSLTIQAANRITFIGTEERDNIVGNSQGNVITGLGDNDTLLGGDGSDQITGGAGNDSLNGENDDDTLRGQDGRDSLIGGLGDDSLSGDRGNDQLSGGMGDDTLIGGNNSDTLFGQDGNDFLQGGFGRDTLSGSTGSDILQGGIGSDVLIGGTDDDSLLGQGGRDTLQGEAGNDTLNGSIGDDLLEGGFGNDFLQGGNNNDSLFGQEGSDTLVGGIGNDVLTGGTGNDILTGGTGADSFRLTGLAGSGTDRIRDFSSNDTLVLSRSVFNLSGTIGSNISSIDFDTVNSVTDAGRSTGVIIYDRSSGRLFHNTNGTTGGFGTGGQFSRLDNRFNLQANDIILDI